MRRRGFESPQHPMKIKYPNNRGTRGVTICKFCGEEFETLAIKIRAGKEKFCCKECYDKYRKEHSYNPKERNILYQIIKNLIKNKLFQGNLKLTKKMK